MCNRNMQTRYYFFLLPNPSGSPRATGISVIRSWLLPFAWLRSILGWAECVGFSSIIGHSGLVGGSGVELEDVSTQHTCGKSPCALENREPGLTSSSLPFSSPLRRYRAGKNSSFMAIGRWHSRSASKPVLCPPLPFPMCSSRPYCHTKT